MDAVSYLNLQFAGLHERQALLTLAGITDEQLNWTPPGAANKIGVILLHAISGEDQFIQEYLQAKPLLWETQGWGEKFGLPCRPGGDQGWEEARRAQLKLPVIMEYNEAVIRATEAYLASLTPEALDRRIPFYGYQFPVAQLLGMCVSHTVEHMGEIHALKGIFSAPSAS